MNVYPPNIVIEEQGLRDGLQSEKPFVPTEKKLEIIGLVADAGVKRIQVTSFVHPKLVPQMADAEEICRGLDHSRDVIYSGLVLNSKGLERALNTGLSHVEMVVSASDAHSRRNVNRSLEEALPEGVALIKEAKQAGLHMRGTVSCSFGCVYEGAVPEDRVISILEAMAGAGADAVCLADTTGMGNPVQMRRLCRRALELFPETIVPLHLHDTRGLGLANILAAYEVGIRHFDVCAGGLGGCPFVKGAAGNVSAEDVVNMFEGIGVKTGIDLNRLCAVVDMLESLLDRELPGRMNRVVKAARDREEMEK